MNDNSKKKNENKMLENDYINIEEIENNYINIDDDEYIKTKEKNNTIRDNKVWTEKDTIEAETQQMADLLGFNSEMKIQENKKENIKEGKKQEKIPEILYQRKKYKGKKKKK